MTPKEKAKELVDKMTFEIGKFNSIECALICVKEIEEIILNERIFESMDYWRDVRIEIENL